MDKYAFYEDLDGESLKSWEVILEEIQDFINELDNVSPEVEVHVEGRSSMAEVLDFEVKERLEYEVREQFLDFKNNMAQLLEQIKDNSVTILVEADTEWIKEEIDYSLSEFKRPYDCSVSDREEGLRVKIDLWDNFYDGDVYEKIYNYLCS